jgi:thiol-disulfide isomerase/thioredoxin
MTRSRHRLVLALAGALLACACESGSGPEGPRGRAAPAAPAAPAAQGTARLRPLFLRGPTGGAPVASFIAGELAKGRTDHRGVLVYVGATWCEPCQSFHRAVQAGELDDMLDGVRLVEFDLDADRQPLESAGYGSRLIPLFALPKNDGTASERRIEGSVKGPGALEQNLMPRLKSFLRGQLDG